MLPASSSRTARGALRCPRGRLSCPCLRSSPLLSESAATDRPLLHRHPLLLCVRLLRLLHPRRFRLVHRRTSQNCCNSRPTIPLALPDLSAQETALPLISNCSAMTPLSLLVSFVQGSVLRPITNCCRRKGAAHARPQRTAPGDLQLAFGFAPVRAYYLPFHIFCWGLAAAALYSLFLFLRPAGSVSDLGTQIAVDGHDLWNWTKGGAKAIWRGGYTWVQKSGFGEYFEMQPQEPRQDARAWTSSELFGVCFIGLFLVGMLFHRDPYEQDARAPAEPPSYTSPSPSPSRSPTWDGFRCTCAPNTCAGCKCKKAARECSTHCVCHAVCKNAASAPPDALPRLSTAEICDLGRPHILTFIGLTESGKSTALKDLMVEFQRRNHFAFGIAMVGSGYTGDYDYLGKENVWDCDEERFYAYLEGLRARQDRQPNPPNVVILDDLLGSLNVTGKEFGKFISTFRHTNTWIIICTQSMTKGTSTILRDNTNGAFMFGTISQPTIKILWEYWGSLLGNLDKFRSIFWATAVDYACLVYLRSRGAAKYYSFKARPADPTVMLKLGKAPYDGENIVQEEEEESADEEEECKKDADFISYSDNEGAEEEESGEEIPEGMEMYSEDEDDDRSQAMEVEGEVEDGAEEEEAKAAEPEADRRARFGGRRPNQRSRDVPNNVAEQD